MFLELLKKSSFFLIIGIAVILFFVFQHEPAESTTELTPVADQTKEVTEQNETTGDENIIVDVKGAVKNPGIYEIHADSRVNDVIELAGGFLKQADQTVVNLAQQVQDEMVIAVPEIGDDTSGIQADEVTGSGQAKLKINQATQAEIEKLNGIGPSKAQAIIDYREENGLFQTVDDLLEVSGIGEKTLESLKDMIQVP
ncbi:helix-hairpin-helix domain-containing protein [Lentibacillus sp. N15]|uniref:helix-hairpin-helix domain-containing protein n=1 Tax=Lentibacillus songyuanensis TaxID=3136161 RepID=UPI0031BA11C6